MENLFDVVIIGAGVAGLSAAQKLKSEWKGSKPLKVVVLEGRNRIGGRMWTDSSDFSSPIDLGCQWVGVVGKGHPIGDLCKDNKISMSQSDFESVAVHQSENGNSIGMLQLWKSYELMATLKGKCEKIGKDANHDSSFGEIWNQVKSESQGKLSPLEIELLDSLSKIELEYEFGYHRDNFSVKYGKTCNGTFGDKDFVLPNGHSQITEILAKSIDIRLEHVVQEITRNSNDKTILIKSIHQGNQIEIIGKRVLVTVPLGVLKSNKISFNPPLPQEKQDAISCLGFGSMNKIVLEFSSAPWPSKELILLTGPQTRFLLNWKKHSNKNILIVFLYEPIENEKKEIEIVMQGLKKICPNIPEPSKVKITNWNQDPFACGSYSSFAFGSSPTTPEIIGQSIEKSIFFAGEHVTAKYLGTSHGAFISAVEAAKEILSTLV